MFASRIHCHLFAAVLFLHVMCGMSLAGDRSDLYFENGLNEEIADIRIRYATPYDESRYHNSPVYLPSGGYFSLGVHGATGPEVIIFDLATKSLVFDDLGGISPDSNIRLIVVHADGAPRLRRLNYENEVIGEVTGSERVYLTSANRPNAVDKDNVMLMETVDEFAEMLAEHIGEVGEEQGELTRFELEAGPIWNQEHARERCPEVAAEWSEANGREARWTGKWGTTVEGEMSVCGCVAGTASMQDTVTHEDDGWGAREYFPVFWKDLVGVGAMPQPDDDDRTMFAVAMRFRLPDEGAAVLDGLFEDLRVDGYRPLRFLLTSAEEDEDGDLTSREELIDFRETDDDKWDNHEKIITALETSYAGPALKGELFWITDDAFEKLKQAKDGEDTDEAEGPQSVRGVLCTFSKGVLDALFLRNARMFM